MIIEGTILGKVPSKSNCYIIIKRGQHCSMAKGKALKAYENSFYMQIGKHRDAMIDEYFEYEVDVYYPSNRSDLDNSLKIQLDCLQVAKVIKNDNKCTKIVARKFIDKLNPRIEFKIILAKSIGG